MVTDGQPLNPILVDGVDEGPGLSAGVRDAMEIGDEALSHFVAREVAIGQAETADSVLLDGLSFSLAIPDTSVLHEDDPALLPRQSEPLLVGHFLVLWDTVVLGQSDKTKPFCSQKLRDFDPAEAPIE